jgi:hypothetical protein
VVPKAKTQKAGKRDDEVVVIVGGGSGGLHTVESLRMVSLLFCWVERFRAECGGEE